MNKKFTFVVEEAGDKLLIKCNETGKGQTYSSTQSIGRFVFEAFNLDPKLTTKKQLNPQLPQS